MYVFIVHCVYCLYVTSFFLHCLEHALKNFTHQDTCAVVMWQEKWFDLILNNIFKQNGFILK